MHKNDILLLRQDDMRGLLPIQDAVEAVRAAYLDHEQSPSLNVLCHRLKTPDNVRVCVHQGASPSTNGAGVFAHSELLQSTATEELIAHQGPPVTIVYSSEDARLRGILIGEPTSIEAPDSHAIAGVRTAATSIVGTTALARTNSRTLGLLGTGRQAEIHLFGFAATYDLDLVKVYSRTAANRESFAKRMSESLGLRVESVQTASAAVSESDIVLTTTNSVEPVLKGSWLNAGQHVTSIVGGMVGISPPKPSQTQRRELDDETDKCATRIALASLEQAYFGFSSPRFQDLKGGFERVMDAYPYWDKCHELSEVLGSALSGRQSDSEITLFKNNAGQGIADIAIASLVVERALQLNIGTRVLA